MTIRQPTRLKFKHTKDRKVELMQHEQGVYAVLVDGDEQSSTDTYFTAEAEFFRIIGGARQ